MFELVGGYIGKAYSNAIHLFSTFFLCTFELFSGIDVHTDSLFRNVTQGLGIGGLL
jgi:hypothetical protein